MCWCFNPRPREGATKDIEFEVVFKKVSIHAPVKGRRGISFKELQRKSFNPRPREGATQPEKKTLSLGFSFNPRPREGATRWVANHGF